jgi:hypothetical protein
VSDPGTDLSRYEVYCPRCQVSHPPGTRICLHCGGRTTARGAASGGPHPLRARSGPVPTAGVPPEEEEEGVGGAPRGLRIGLTVVWLALAVAASLYRACAGGS